MLNISKEKTMSTLLTLSKELEGFLNLHLQQLHGPGVSDSSLGNFKVQAIGDDKTKTEQSCLKFRLVANESHLNNDSTNLFEGSCKVVNELNDVIKKESEANPKSVCTHIEYMKFKNDTLYCFFEENFTKFETNFNSYEDNTSEEDDIDQEESEITEEETLEDEIQEESIYDSKSLGTIESAIREVYGSPTQTGNTNFLKGKLQLNYTAS
jgi:hypothetical protein